MTECSRGDVVLVSFVFTDESGERRRPAVIVSSDAYHQSRQEAIIAAITSRTDRVTSDVNNGHETSHAATRPA